MTALILDAGRSYKRITFELVPLAAGVKAIKGGLAMLITASTGTGYYAPADDARTGIVKGVFAETVDNTAGLIGALSANVEYGEELYVELMGNDTGSPVLATDRGKICYALDDATVTMAVGTCAAGIVHGLSDDGLVEVELLPTSQEGEAPGISAVAPVDPSSSAAAVGVAALASPQDHKHHIPVAIPAAEGLMSGAQAGTFHAPVADLTALKAIAAADRAAGMLCLVLADVASEVSLWRFHATSTAADTSENLVAAPVAGAGRWLRADKIVNLCLAVDYTKADNATIFTVPVGARLRPITSYWDITTTFAGGTNSAIGVHASPTGFTTKGDILGGATGDLTATLVSTNTRKVGTAGAKQGSADFGLILLAADTVKFDRIASVYTSGAGNVRVPCELIANPGA